MRVEVEDSDGERLKARTGRATVAAAIRELAKVEKEVYFTYPANGGEATLPTGKTTLDLQTGEVSMPDGTTDRLSTSLKVERREYARSVFIKADQSVDVSLDGGGEHTLEADDCFILPHQPFKRVYITTTASTKIQFWASTDPEGVLKKIKGSFPEMLIYGTKLDTDGTSDYFETDQALGATPTLYIPLTPSDVKNFVLESVRFYMNPTNAVTYQLYLLEDAQADDVTSYGNVVFDSGSGKAADTIYITARGDKLPMLAKLATAGRLYYMIDWSGAPGNTPGFIEIRGRVMV